MITKLYLHELKMREDNFLLKEKDLEKDILFIEIIDSYEIHFKVIFSKKYNLKDFFKILLPLNSDFEIEEVNLYDNYKLLFYENNGTEIKLEVDKGNVIAICGKIIEESSLIKKLINILKFPVVIMEKKEKIRKYDENDKKQNYFPYKVITYYLDFLNIHTGLMFYMIKYHIYILLNFIELNKKEIINNEDIVIQNSFSTLMNKKLNKRWHINKKHHVLNISNVKKINNFQIFINQKNKKYYMKKDGVYYNIKNFLFLNRKNVLKIKEKYNRSNEILGIYENNKTKKKYILKITKSISQKLENKLEEISIEDFLETINHNF